MVFSFKDLYAYGFIFKQLYVYGIFSHMGFQIRCSYRYYTLTILVWGTIFNNTRTVSKKSPYEYGFPYWYSDARMCMVIFLILLLTYTSTLWSKSSFYVEPCKKKKSMIVLMKQNAIPNIYVKFGTRKNEFPQDNYLSSLAQPEITRYPSLMFVLCFKLSLWKKN